MRRVIKCTQFWDIIILVDLDSVVEAPRQNFLTTPRDANGINAMCMDFSRKFYTHTVEFGRIMYLGWQYRAASMAER